MQETVDVGSRIRLVHKIAEKVSEEVALKAVRLRFTGGVDVEEAGG